MTTFHEIHRNEDFLQGTMLPLFTCLVTPQWHVNKNSQRISDNCLFGPEGNQNTYKNGLILKE